MALERFSKTEWERVLLCADYSSVLDTNEAVVLASSEVTAIDKDGNDVTSDVLMDGTKTVTSDGYLGMRCKGGVRTDCPYKITFKAITDGGNRWQLDIIMVVKDQK